MLDVIDPSLQLYETTMRVQPGDVLFDYPDVRFLRTGGRLVIEEPVADAFQYVAAAGESCGGTGQSTIPSEIDFNQYNYCATNTTVVVHPIGNVGAELPIAYAVFENVNLDSTEQTPLRVTSWSTDTAPHQITIDASSGGVISASCSVFSMNAGLKYPARHYADSNSATSYQFDLRFAEVGDAAGYRCFMTQELGARREKAEFVPAPLAASLAFAEDDLLPNIVDITGDGEPVRPTLSWSVVPDQASEDFVIASVQGMASTGVFSHWRIVGPPGTRSLQVPALPPDLEPTFMPSAVPTVHLFESTDVPDYAVARKDTVRFYLATIRRDAPIPRTERSTSTGRI